MQSKVSSQKHKSLTPLEPPKEALLCLVHTLMDFLFHFSVLVMHTLMSKSDLLMRMVKNPIKEFYKLNLQVSCLVTTNQKVEIHQSKILLQKMAITAQAIYLNVMSKDSIFLLDVQMICSFVEGKIFIRPKLND